MNPVGDPIAFCKVSLDAVNDASLRDEADALETMRQLSLQRSETPQVMLRRSFGNRYYVAYAPLPRGGAPFSGDWTNLSMVVDEFGGAESRLSARALADLAWWQRFSAVRAQCGSAFLEAVGQAAAAGVRVRRVHGDFTPANIMRVGPRIWLCDWEFSSATGPYWTDRVSFHLACHHRDCLTRPRATLDTMLRAFAAESGTTAAEVAMALAFLCGCGNQAAQSLARHWDGKQELAAAD
jgi:hypothetical protein